jgi:hypothetical protein
LTSSALGTRCQATIYHPVRALGTWRGLTGIICSSALGTVAIRPVAQHGLKPSDLALRALGWVFS